jgi:hypothetical protein
MRGEMRKKAGRPGIAASERRETIMRFVVTKAEGTKIRTAAKSQSLTLSEYLRSVSIPK